MYTLIHVQVSLAFNPELMHQKKKKIPHTNITSHSERQDTVKRNKYTNNTCIVNKMCTSCLHKKIYIFLAKSNVFWLDKNKQLQKTCFTIMFCVYIFHTTSWNCWHVVTQDINLPQVLILTEAVTRWLSSHMTHFCPLDHCQKISTARKAFESKMLNFHHYLNMWWTVRVFYGAIRYFYAWKCSTFFTCNS